MSTIEFVVEEAGCESCAALVREALEPLAAVETVEPDHDADTAAVRVRGELTEAAANEALAAVGHAYRVRAGSWRVELSATM